MPCQYQHNLYSKAIQCEAQYIRPQMAQAGHHSVTEHKHILKDGYIAYRLTECQQQREVDVIFLHGLLSNMSGTKARALEQQAQQLGHGFLCFDARGHGSSSGTFQETHLGDWYADALTAMDLAPAARHILVGSSFGGWQALHLAAEHPGQVAGLVLIAPALDFTSKLWCSYSPEQQQAAQRQGTAPVGSKYVDGGQVLVNMSFFKEAERFLVLDRLQELNVQCPVRILHGMKDDVVPYSLGQQVLERLRVDDMVLSLIKDGDHRLSRPQDLQLILSALHDLLQQVAVGDC